MNDGAFLEGAADGAVRRLSDAAMKRVPHLLHVFPTFEQGGVALRIGTVMTDLAGTYRHTVIALDGNFGARQRLSADVPVSYLDLSLEKTRPIRTLRTIRSTLRRIRPDLLLTYNWGSIEWAAVNRLWRVAPHVHLESGFGPEEANGQLPRRVRARRFALGRTRRVVVPSRNLVRIATEIWRLDPRRVLYVPNGVDCALYESAPDPSLAPALAKAGGAVTVGTVAPLRGEKNIARLLRCFAAVGPQRDAVLLIAGDGDERPALERMAAELGLGGRVLFVGHVDRPERVYGLIDVFAISSDTEQMPNALVQAMAAGRAVVSTDVGDVGEMVAEPNRPFVTPLGDDDAYGAAMARLIDAATLRQALGAANRRRANEIYPLSAMFAAYRALLAEACAA